MDRLRKLLAVLVIGLVGLIVWLERRAQAERRQAAERAGATPEGTTQPDAASSAQEARLYAAEAAEPPMDTTPASDSEAPAFAAETPQPEPSAEAGAIATDESEATDDAEIFSSTSPAAEAEPPADADAEAETLTFAGVAVEPVPGVPLQGWVEGDGSRDCPPNFPIKGNANSMIYHQPGESSYDVTIPEICFATEEDAQAAGYRPRRH